MAVEAPTPSPFLDGTLAHFRGLDDQDLVDALQRRVRARRAADAEDAALLVALQERSEAGHGYVSNQAAEEIGWMLAISSRSACALVDASLELTSRPLVWQAMADGLLDRVKALKIVHLLAGIDDPRREALERKAIAFGTTHTPAQLHRKLVAMTCDNDPDGTARKEALDSRGVWIDQAGHGMVTIHAKVSADIGSALMQSIDQIANGNCADPYEQGEARTLTQRRADALAGYLADHTFWDIHVQVTIPADMLMGVETSGASLNGSPCTHALALHLAWSPDARWTRLVTDPLTGVLLDPGTKEYRIPVKLRNAVRLRDQTCRWPGCTRPAEFTDTDHVIPHRIDKWTSAKGLNCLCRYHHRLKTFGAWHTHTHSTYGHDTTWIGPLGTRRTTRPPDLHRRT